MEEIQELGFSKFPKEKTEFSSRLQSTSQINHSPDNVIHDVILTNLVSNKQQLFERFTVLEKINCYTLWDSVCRGENY